MLDGLYVHLPLKRAMYAIDPLQRLRLLGQRIGELSDAQFQDELIDTFTELRDLHTNYLLPSSLQDKTAFLPFLVEECFEGKNPTYVVSKLIAGFTHPTFVPGVTVTSWNGVPFARAVERNADRQAGSNPDARRARGIEAMTVRWLGQSPLPDEDWVIVGYTTASGKAEELRLAWQVFIPEPSPQGVDPANGRVAASRLLGIDEGTERVRRAKKHLFAPKAMETERAAARHAPVAADTSTMPDVFAFRTVDTRHGTYGYVRIWTFDVDDDEAFVDEFVRILGLLPPHGLVLDVRGNGGGLIPAAEKLLQTLTPHPIEPARFSFRCSPLTQALCQPDDPDLGQWAVSIARSVETGEAHSQPLPLYPAAEVNRRGQRYQGPVVLVTDALCYSSTDIFAAGFQDHGIGPVLGVARATGAGGANVWDYALLRQLFGPTGPFGPLPKGTSYRVAIRRVTRGGTSAGVPLEDLGVVPDVLVRTTRRDLLESNVDLIAAAAKLLKGQPKRSLATTVTEQGSTGTTLAVTASGVDRVDVLVGGRPRASVDLPGSAAVTVPETQGEAVLQGYANGDLVVVAHATLSAS